MDTHIKAALVSGYLRNRWQLWQEPICRNVWGLLPEYADAEPARMVAPRALVIEAVRHPEVAGPPPEREGRRGAAPGRITTTEATYCSADFNEWTRKSTSVDEPFSYMYTGEYEMPEFNLGHTFNYAELAWLMMRRPFMVQRDHRDGVGIHEWVAYEYAKVRRLYTFPTGIIARCSSEVDDHDLGHPAA